MPPSPPGRGAGHRLTEELSSPAGPCRAPLPVQSLSSTPSCHVSELYTLVADEATALDDEELFVAARSLDHLNTRLTGLVSESR